MVKGAEMVNHAKMFQVVVGLAALVGEAFGQGVILWDESVNGELSQDFTHPTSLTPLLAGTNSIIGATEIIPYGNTWGLSPDEFVLIIPSNLVLTAVFLTVDKSKVWAWIGDPSYFNQL